MIYTKVIDIETSIFWGKMLNPPTHNEMKAENLTWSMSKIYISTQFTQILKSRRLENDRNAKCIPPGVITMISKI